MHIFEAEKSYLIVAGTTDEITIQVTFYAYALMPTDWPHPEHGYLRG